MADPRLTGSRLSFSEPNPTVAVRHQLGNLVTDGRKVRQGAVGVDTPDKPLIWRTEPDGPLRRCCEIPYIHLGVCGASGWDHVGGSVDPILVEQHSATNAYVDSPTGGDLDAQRRA